MDATERKPVVQKASPQQPQVSESNALEIHGLFLTAAGSTLFFLRAQRF